MDGAGGGTPPRVGRGAARRPLGAGGTAQRAGREPPPPPAGGGPLPVARSSCQRWGPGVRSDAAADSGPAAECSSTGASMVAPALGHDCCCTRGDRPAERAPAPAGAGFANKGRPVSGGLVWCWPPPPLGKVPFIGRFLYRGETIKGAAPPLPPQALPPLCCSSEFG